MVTQQQLRAKTFQPKITPPKQVVTQQQVYQTATPTQMNDTQKKAYDEAVKLVQRRLRGGSMGSFSSSSEADRLKMDYYNKIISADNARIGRAIDESSSLRQDLQTGNFYIDPSYYAPDKYGNMSIDPETKRKLSKEIVSGVSVDAQRQNIPEFLRNQTIGNFDAKKVKSGYDYTPPKVDRGTYDPYSKTYVKLSESSSVYGKSTLVMTPPSPTEQAKIDTTKYKADLYYRSITGVPAQMLGGIFTTPTTEAEKESITGLGYFNPKKQYNIFKKQFDYNYNIKEARETAKKLEQLNKRYDAGEIDYQKYSARFGALSQNKNYQSIISSPERTTIYQDIAKSKLSEKGKFAASGVVGAADFASFLIPQVRVVRGSEMVSSGTYDFSKADTKGEQVKAGIEVGLGGVIVASGFKTGKPLFPKFSGTSKIAKIASTSLSWGVPAAFSGAYGFGVYKQTGSLSVGLGAGVGGFVGIKSQELYAGAKVTGKELKDGWVKLYRDKRAKAGTRQKTVQKTKVKKKKKKVVKVSREEYVFKQEGKTFREKTTAEKVDTIRKDLNELIQSGDKKGFNEYYNFLKKIYGEAEAKTLMSEYFAQEGYAITTVKAAKKVSGEIQKTKTVSETLSSTQFSEIGKTKTNVLYSEQSNRFGTTLVTTSPYFREAQMQQAKTMQNTKQQMQQKTKQATSQVSSQSSLLETLQRVVPKQTRRFRPQIRQRAEKPKEPDKIKPIFPELSLPKRLAKKVEEEPELFEVFTRKFGEDIKIGKARTKEAAVGILKKRIGTTLRASGFIEKGGVKLKASEIKLGSTFGVSKKDEFRIIEKKTKRIKRGTMEIPEIISFKRKKKKSLFGF